MAVYWSPIATEYDPLKAGSIDGTDEEPHDHGIVRAMNAKYRPNKGVIGVPECTVFVARLHPRTTEDGLSDAFARYGPIKRVRLVTDIITGFSKCYGFVEFESNRDADKACRDATNLLIDGQEVYVDHEVERKLKGWTPRRLGGGLGGRKESGQLRFGGKDRPFRKPILLESSMSKGRPSDRQGDAPRRQYDNKDNPNRWNDRFKDRHPRSPDRRSYGSRKMRSRSRSQERSYKSSHSHRTSGKSSNRRSRSRERYSRSSRSGRY